MSDGQDEHPPIRERERMESIRERAHAMQERGKVMRRQAEAARTEAAEIRDQCAQVGRGERTAIPRPVRAEGQAERTCPVCGAPMPEGVGCSLCPGSGVDASAEAFGEARERWDAAEVAFSTAEAAFTTAQDTHNHAEVDWEQDQTAWQRAREAAHSPSDEPD